MKFLPLLGLALLVSCTPRPTESNAPQYLLGDPSAPSQVTPQESMAIAQRFSTHPWQPFARNILHGPDQTGILVNTPDAGHAPGEERRGWWLPGQVNTGIPYKWGGFDTPSSFDTAIANGLAGGDVSSPAKRQADNAAVSSQAAGVDCSGFVSQCLKLPKGYDTTQLPSICTELASPHALRPGDLLNIPHRHVVLCAGWADTAHQWLYFYETGGAPDYWKPGLKRAPLQALLDLGYKPLRYRGMAVEIVPTGKEPRMVLTRAAKASAEVITHPTVGEP